MSKKKRLYTSLMLLLVPLVFSWTHGFAGTGRQAPQTPATSAKVAPSPAPSETEEPSLTTYQDPQSVPALPPAPGDINTNPNWIAVSNAVDSYNSTLAEIIAATTANQPNTTLNPANGSFVAGRLTMTKTINVEWGTTTTTTYLSDTGSIQTITVKRSRTGVRLETINCSINFNQPGTRAFVLTYNDTNGQGSLGWSYTVDGNGRLTSQSSWHRGPAR